MSGYLVSFWIENQGDVPDYYVQLQANAPLLSSPCIKAAMLAIGIAWAREVKVEVMSNGCLYEVFARSNVFFSGAEKVPLYWSVEGRVVEC